MKRGQFCPCHLIKNGVFLQREGKLSGGKFMKEKKRDGEFGTQSCIINQQENNKQQRQNPSNNKNPELGGWALPVIICKMNRT
mmetsp:Transcript_44055/g.72523  ORF Transcript_44055/g.72523 Transcript_44055/m.72523 type:complete len:83 (-) Transcript_44055:937-1185(-)